MQFIDCDFDDDDMVCRRCGRKAQTRTTKSNCALKPEAIVTATARPGTELHDLLGRFGLTASGDCKCTSRAALMDANGCDWCEANIDEIVGWLRESAAERGLPFLDAVGRVLIRRAIHNARRKEQARAQEASQAEGPAPAG